MIQNNKELQKKLEGVWKNTMASGNPRYIFSDDKVTFQNDNGVNFSGAFSCDGEKLEFRFTRFNNRKCKFRGDERTAWEQYYGISDQILNIVTDTKHCWGLFYKQS